MGEDDSVYYNRARGNFVNGSIQRTPRRLTFEEEKTLKQCGKEATIYRGLPSALLSGMGMWYLKTLGYIRPHGFALKVGAVCTGSYFMGMISYRNVCTDRIMCLPNSPLGDELRRKTGRSGTPELSGTQQAIGDATVAAMPSVSGVHHDSETFPGILRETSDMYKADDVGTSDNTAAQVPSQYQTSYDELRRKNREEFLKKMRPSGYPMSPSQGNNTGLILPRGRDQKNTYPSSISEIEGKPMLGKYGDEDYVSFK